MENRPGAGGADDHRPQLSDLRESGAIEQDADMVLFIHRPEYYRIYRDENGNDLRGKAMIIIAKHRNGAVGDVLLTFKGKYTRFENMDENNSFPLPGTTDSGGLPPMGGGPITDADFAPLPGDSITPFRRERGVWCRSKGYAPCVDASHGMSLVQIEENEQVV